MHALCYLETYAVRLYVRLPVGHLRQKLQCARHKLENNGFSTGINIPATMRGHIWSEQSGLCSLAY